VTPDFTPLALKLLSKGKTVIGFGESKTPEPFVKACSVFIHTDDFKEPSADNPLPSGTARKTKNELRGDTELMNVLRAAIESMKGENGFAPMTRIGQYVSNHSSLSSKNYGYARWSDLIRAMEYFEEHAAENNHVSFSSRRLKHHRCKPIRTSGFLTKKTRRQSIYFPDPVNSPLVFHSRAAVSDDDSIEYRLCDHSAVIMSSAHS
jgi:OST-HTH/LOTUS domain